MVNMKNLFDVDGRIAIVTGGSRGLGQAMAVGLAEAGAKVAVVARSAVTRVHKAESEQDNVNLTYFQCDLSDRKQRMGLVDKIIAEFGRIDILVNNAGLQHRANALDYPEAFWDEDIELMLTAVLDLSQQAAKYMLTQGYGKIIQIASISSFQGARQIIGYATVKHGIVGLTKCLANEWAGQGINVNAIAPGLFDTDMAAHVISDSLKANELRGRIPAGRFGKPNDIIGPLLFLASDASRHVHGHVLLVDGGWMGR